MDSSLRRRGRAASPGATPKPGATVPGFAENGAASPGTVAPATQPYVSLLKFRGIKDFLARLAFVSIFIFENGMHTYHFEREVDGLVAPALAPLPREAAVSLHVVHIVFGLFGAALVVASGFDTAGRTALTKGTSMMLVFMSTITWTWWINREGIPIWEMDPYYFFDVRSSVDKRNRMVHILKNVAIFGALTMLQQLAKYEQQEHPVRPTLFEGLVTALRPWSWTATLAPQLVALSVIRCHLGIPLPGYTVTIMTILSIMAGHIVANLVNSLKDFESGTDTKETASDRTLVDELISVRLLRGLVAFALLWWWFWFVWVLAYTGLHPIVVSMGLLGIAMAIGYTAGPAPLKYLGFGDVAVFICFGPGVVAFSCVILAGALYWEVIIFCLPVALYSVATLHANNYRDIGPDTRSGAVTVAIKLGRQGSRAYYALLLASAHVVALAAGRHYGCAGCLGTLVVLPQSVWLNLRIRNDSMLATQDEETAKTTMMFGVALALGIVVNAGPEPTALGLGVTALVVLVLKVFAN